MESGGTAKDNENTQSDNGTTVHIKVLVGETLKSKQTLVKAN